MVLEPRDLKGILNLHLQDEDLWPKTKSGIITTFCNCFVQRVCTDFGYDNFNKPAPWGMLANEIAEYCETAQEWAGLGMDDAHHYAMSNCLVLAAQQGKPHGHVAVIFPDKLKIYSGKWQKYVPRIANVGISIGIMGLNFAFKDMPKFYLLRGRP